RRAAGGAGGRAGVRQAAVRGPADLEHVAGRGGHLDRVGRVGGRGDRQRVVVQRGLDGLERGRVGAGVLAAVVGGVRLDRRLRRAHALLRRRVLRLVPLV